MPLVCDEAESGAAGSPQAGPETEARPTSSPTPISPGASPCPPGIQVKWDTGRDARMDRLREMFKSEYQPLSESRQRVMVVEALSMLAHRQWGVPGAVAEAAARRMFVPDEWGVYRLSRWREGDEAGAEWGELVRHLARAAEMAGEEAPREDVRGDPEDASTATPGDPGQPRWWLKATTKARSMWSRLTGKAPSAPENVLDAAGGGRAAGVRTEEPVWGRLARLAGDAFRLQWIFGRCRGAWRRGGLRHDFVWLRPSPWTRCGGGANLAVPSEFSAQAADVEGCLAWYELYVAAFRRLKGSAAMLDLCCGGGGQSQGAQRLGAVPMGIDQVEMRSYASRFGEGAFVRADVLEPGIIRGAVAQVKNLVGIMAGPSCKGTSTATFAGVPSKEPVVINELRDKIREIGVAYSIEQPLGSSRWMKEPTILRGSMFGLRVDRPRMFETSFKMHVDECLMRGARELRPRTCIGALDRYKACDEYGRWQTRECCEGNILAVQGSGASRAKAARWADAMDLDLGDMTPDEVSQAIPPAYSQYVFGQMAMWEMSRQFGCPIVTYDEVLADPSKRHELMAWVRGAGAASSAPVQFETRPRSAGPPDTGGSTPESQDGVARASPGVAKRQAKPGEKGWSLEEADFRELEYSVHGDFDASVLDEGAPDWLGALRSASCWRGNISEGGLKGRNTYVQCGVRRLKKILPILVAAMAHRGTRLTVVAPMGSGTQWATQLEGAGLAQVGFPAIGGMGVRSFGGGSTVLEEPIAFWAGGRRLSAVRGRAFDFDAIRPFLDPLDSGESCVDGKAKEALAFAPYPVPDHLAWEAAGAPDDVVAMFRDGARLGVDEEGVCGEVGQYPWPDPIAYRQCVVECDRALWVGAMETVPDSEVARVEATGRIHPWTIVHQGGSKWRACHDYSCITNGLVAPSRFRLPSPWDVAKVLKPGSYLAKYDLRDGFWSVPVYEGDRHNLCIRHPTSGRLLWASRLPFGFNRSPELFCRVTESVAEIVRKRGAGMGFQVFCFVDDYCVTGDDYEATKRGCEILEATLEELGLQWAPHKRRGPCKALDFLGRFISNVPGHRGVGLSEDRLRHTTEMIGQWSARKPPGGGDLSVDPRDLACLLGNLVFVSEAVRGGRTYLQCCLGSFKGLEVDWDRGEVRPSASRGKWGEMVVGAGFWRDLEWWEAQLATNHRYELDKAGGTAATAMLTGTDASGWGTGQLAFIGGEVEEEVLRFTRAEQRRPINWRELLGILRVIER